jgi:hypothetical protein
VLPRPRRVRHHGVTDEFRHPRPPLGLADEERQLHRLGDIELGDVSGSENSPKTSNFSSGVNALPIAFASIARSTDATILFSCSIRSVSSSRWRFR